MSEKDIAISVREAVKSFIDPQGQPFRVLDGVTFDIYRGETIVIMGGSGCGKSTLLNCLIGEYRIDSGRILYHTKTVPETVDLGTADERGLNELRKRFGILFQSGALFSSMTVAQNVALPLIEHSYVDPSIIDIVVTLKLQQVKMLAHRDKMPSQLSGARRSEPAWRVRPHWTPRFCSTTSRRRVSIR